MLKSNSEKNLFKLDIFFIVLFSILICLFAKNLLFMSIATAFLVCFRLAAIYKIETLKNFKVELVFFIICTLIGAYNDWNSVFVKKIYSYSVPVFFENISTIPFWMLLYWGIILQFFSRFTVFESKRNKPKDDVLMLKGYVSSKWLKIFLQLAIIVITRTSIYSLYEHPYLSWVPFAFAIGFYFLFFRPGMVDFYILAVFLAGGPIIEALYINLGGLHFYHQGVFFGVPVWIILWWGLAILIWKDIGARIKLGTRFFFQ